MVGGEVHPVVAEGELANDGKMEVPDAGGVEAGVVRGPAGAERPRAPGHRVGTHPRAGGPAFPEGAQLVVPASRAWVSPSRVPMASLS